MSLLYKPLDLITEADLQALKDNGVREGLHIEYKEEVFDKRDDEKRRQFLGSVSAFANAAGGDLIIGVAANDGLPVDVPGLEAARMDEELNRIEQVVRTGIDPHLPMSTRVVPLSNGRSVIMVRVFQSWTAPHGIKHQGHLQFFRRHSAGRLPMTLAELRSTFALSGTVGDHTRTFRMDRLRWLTAPDGPWGYIGKPLAVLHIVPFTSALSTVALDLSRLRSADWLSPHRRFQGHFNPGELRYNIDGVLMRKSGSEFPWHTQLFRTGAIEHATTLHFDPWPASKSLDAWGLQVTVINLVSRFLKRLVGLEVSPPATIMLSLLNVANLQLQLAVDRGSHSIAQFDRECLEMPDLVLDSAEENIVATLKPLFDSLWNAAGMRGCGHYNANGEWSLHPSFLDDPDEA